MRFLGGCALGVGEAGCTVGVGEDGLGVVGAAGAANLVGGGSTGCAGGVKLEGDLLRVVPTSLGGGGDTNPLTAFAGTSSRGGLFGCSEVKPLSCPPLVAKASLGLVLNGRGVFTGTLVGTDVNARWRGGWLGVGFDLIGPFVSFSGTLCARVGMVGMLAVDFKGGRGLGGTVEGKAPWAALASLVAVNDLALFIISSMLGDAEGGAHSSSFCEPLWGSPPSMLPCFSFSFTAFFKFEIRLNPFFFPSSFSMSSESLPKDFWGRNFSESLDTNFVPDSIPFFFETVAFNSS